MRSFFRIKISCSCWLQVVFNFGSENGEDQLKSHPVNFLDETVPNNLKLKVIHTFVQKCVWKMIFSFLCKNLRNSPPLKLCSAQHFHPGGTWNGVKLCHWRWLDAVTRAEEGPLSYSVVVGGWTSLGPTTTTNQTLHPSLNPFDKQPRTQSWELHIVGKWVAIFPAGSKRNRNFYEGGSEIGFFEEHGSLVENPDGACRSVPQFCLAWAAVWSDAVQILWSPWA